MIEDRSGRLERRRPRDQPLSAAAARRARLRGREAAPSGSASPPLQRRRVGRLPPSPALGAATRARAAAAVADPPDAAGPARRSGGASAATTPLRHRRPPEPGPRRRRGRDAEPQPGLLARLRAGRGGPSRPLAAAGADGAGRMRRGWFIAEEPEHRGRGSWLLMAFAVMAMAISWKLVDLQVRRAPSLAAQAAATHQLTVPEYAHRGRILDSEGRLLASNLPVYDVFADPGVIPADLRPSVARALGPILAIGPGVIENQLQSPSRYVILKKGVDEDVKTHLAALHIYGVGTVNDDQRVYETAGVGGLSLASNLLGYVNHDGIGQYGVEAFYDAVLRGEAGSYSTLRDLDGNPIVLSDQTDTAARDGRDLQLGLDSRIQYFAEQEISRAVTQFQAESGTVMVMDTKTGSIRAWADFPSFDANSYGEADPGAIKDNAVQALYEPGSVMKLLTFAGGLNKGVITPQTTINEHVQQIDGYTIHDWDGRASHGNVTMQWVLDNSLNNGAINVMQRVGNDDFYRNLLSFGIGSPTGIDVANERSQPLRSQDTWKPIDYATASFGQQVTATPAEMIAAVNAIVNGGVWVQPHAVDAVIDPATGTQTSIAPTSRTVMSPQAAATLRQMMTGVVEDRGASGFAVKMAAFKNQIGGKTGTADVAENGQYGAHVIASFAGFLPASNPRFTMMVIIRKPTNCKTQWGTACEGAYLAAPVWKDIAQLIVDDWKITP